MSAVTIGPCSAREPFSQSGAALFLTLRGETPKVRRMPASGHRNQRDIEAVHYLPVAFRRANRGTVMPKETHTKAAEHHENAAKAHRTAAEHHDKGDHETAHRHSTTAHEHSAQAHQHSTEAHRRSGEQRSAKK